MTGFSYFWEGIKMVAELQYIAPFLFQRPVTIRFFKLSKIFYIFLFALCLIQPLWGAKTEIHGNTSASSSVARSFGVDYTAFTVNNWLYWQYVNGLSALDPSVDRGSMFPRSVAIALYADGVVWGGKVNGQIRVGGSTYRTGLRPILPKIYRVRPNIDRISPFQLKKEAALIFNVPWEKVTDEQLAELYNAYLADMEDWPVEEGAPWIDNIGNGVYDPPFDKPGIAQADQVIYYVVDDSDEGRTYNLYGSPPMGIRAQVTLWGYGTTHSRVGQVVFKRIQLKNISSSTIHDMYISLWADPDIGNYTDDVSGCDSVLGMGFAYNGFDYDKLFSEKGLAPAAVGYDFLQGPLVPSVGDTGRANFQTIPDTKNLDMTAFCYWPSGNEHYNDPNLGEYTGTIQWYNLMQGFMPVESPDNPPPFRHATTGAITTFPVNGDPVTGEGEIDGINNGFYPGARRFALSAGPFTMKSGDEQDIIVAVIGGRPGETRVDAVADLKETDRLVQRWADKLFKTNFLKPPSPKVRVRELENKIILNWGEDLEAVSAVEEAELHDTPLTAYRFEGYTVYQIDPTVPESSKVLIATFDKINGIRTVYGQRFFPEFGEEVTVPVFYGKDSGIQRTFVVDRDYLNDRPLFPGNLYYYEVVACYYNPHPQLVRDSIVTAGTFVSALPQAPPPGTRYSTVVGKEIPVTHIQGNSRARVRVRVVDPAAVTGHTYQIEFQPNPQKPQEVTWRLKDLTLGQAVGEFFPLADSLDNPDGKQVYVDGLEIVVEKINPTYTGFWVVANANGPLPEPEPAASQWSGFPVSEMPSDNQQVGNGIWFIASRAPNPFQYSFSDFVMMTSQYAGGFGEDTTGMTAIVPDDYEIRFDRSSMAFFNWSTQQLDSVPFECWKIGDADSPDDDFQLFPFIQDLETVENQGVFNITHLDHPISSGTNDPMTDEIYFIQPEDRSPGSTGYESIVDYIQQHSEQQIVADSLWKYAKAGLSVPGIAHLTFVNWNGGPVPSQEMPWTDYPYNQLLPEKGTIFRITTSKPVTLEDVYQFQAPEVVRNIALEREDVERITVYPNPFSGDQVSPDGSVTNYVMFYHLPTAATIRIFNIAGQHVKTLQKLDDSQFLRWDLTNDAGRRVASGVYIAYIEAKLSDGSLVKKVLKIFISDVNRTWLK